MVLTDRREEIFHCLAKPFRAKNHTIEAKEKGGKGGKKNKKLKRQESEVRRKYKEE
jgi:hypothetical protein